MLALAAVAFLLASPPAFAAAPSAPSAPTLVSGNTQLAVAWAAPANNGAAIFDYDVRYKATGANTWTDSRGAIATHYWDGHGAKTSNGGNGQAMDLELGSSLGGVTITKLTSGVSNVYRLGGAVAGLRVRVDGANADKPRPEYRARYASTAPTASNMNTHGTLLWSRTPPNTGTGSFVGDAWTPRLTAGTYFWVAAVGSGRSLSTRITVEIEVNSSVTSDTIGGLTNGTSYEVQVRAHNSDGAGAWSPSATLKAGLPAAPAAPVLSPGNAQLTATWGAPADNGSSITGYGAEYCSSNCSAANATWSSANVTVTVATRTATITGLTNGTSYHVRVRAANTHGNGPWSPSATLKAGLPAAPAAPSVTGGAAQLSVSWSAPSANGSAITDYDVRYREKATPAPAWTETADTSSSTTRTATITGLRDGMEYEVQVRAGSSVGDGPWSSSGSATTAAGAPESPAAPTLTPGATQLAVNWTAPHDGGSSITGYDVEYKKTSESTWGTWTHSGTGTSTTITGLDTGTTYEVRVRAKNTHGNSPWSASASADPGGPHTPNVPGITAGDGQLSVSWTAPSDGGSAIDDYDVRYRRVGSGTWTRIFDGGSTGQGHQGGQDTAGSTDPIHFGNFGSSHIGYEDNGFFKAVSAIDEMDLYLQANGGADFNLRTASTKPTANLHTTGTLLGTSSSRSFRGWVGPIAANHYFWGAPSNGNSSTYSTRFRQIYNIDLATTATSFTITNLADDTAYEVQVRAGNANGDGPWSATATARTGVAPAVPTAPTLVSGNAQLAVSWTAPDDGGRPITDYDVRHCSASCDAAGSWTVVEGQTADATTTATITGLTNGTSYQVQVRAGNTAGDGPWSASATLKAGLPAAPAAPALVSGNSQLSASWTAPANHGAVITDYDVRHCSASCDAAGSWTVVKGQTADATTTATVTGLTNGTAYQVQVRAGNTAGDGPWSASATLKAGLPAAPAAPALTPGNTELSASWTAPANHGAVITDYDVRHCSASCDAAGSWTVVEGQTADATTTTTIPGLTNGTSYQVQVRAGNAHGDGPWSASATLKAGLPGAPMALALASGNSQLSVSWTASPGNGANVTGYTIQRCDTNCAASGATWVTAGVSHTGVNTIATITGLTNGTTYTVRVRATNSVGKGAWATATATAGAPAAPAAPTLDSGNAQLTAIWTAPSDSGSAITDYDVRYSSDSGATWTETDDTTPSTGTTATVTGLTNGTSYQVQVRAGNARGDGLWSPSATLKAGLPAAPTAPGVTGGASQLSVSWTAPANHGSVITDYDVRYREKATPAPDWTETDDTSPNTGTTATITGLGNAREYEVQVRAGNSVGDGPWSTSGSATTAAGRPDAPAAPTLTPGTSRLAVAWTAPHDGGSTITGYDVQYKKVSDSGWSSWEHAGTGTSATITGLETGTGYHVQVRAKNNNGDSPWSASASAAAGTPVAPSALTLGSGNTQLSVSWTAPSDGGSAIDDYDVRYRRVGSGTWTRIFDGGSTGHGNQGGQDTAGSTDPIHFGNFGSSHIGYEDNGFFKATSAIDEMHLFLQANGGAEFNLRTASTKPTANLHTTGTLLATSSSRSITAWVGPIAANHYFWGAPADGASSTYTSRFRQIYNIDLATTATSYTITNLTNGTAYEVQVRAGNARGDGPWSPVATATPGLPPAPAPPSLTPGDRSLSVSWDAPAGNGGSAITDYDVRYSSDSGATWAEWNASDTGTATTATITGLTNGTAYRVQVRAGNTNGDSAWSESATGQPALQTVPSLISPRYCAKDGTTYLWVSYICYIAAGQAGISPFDMITLEGESATLVESVYPDGLIAYNPNGGTATVKTELNGVVQDTFTIEVVRFGIRSWSVSDPNVGTDSSFDLTVRLNSPAHRSPDKYMRYGTDLARSWVQLTLPAGLTGADHVRTGQVQDPIQVVGQYGDTVTFTIRTGAVGGNYAIGISAYRPAPDNNCPLTGDPTQGDLRCYAPPVGSGAAEYFVHTASMTARVMQSAPVSVAPPAPPGEVPHVFIHRNREGHVVATWGAASGASGYDVRYTTDSGATWTQAATNQPPTVVVMLPSGRSVPGYTLTQVDTSATYVFNVRAVSSGGTSGWRHSNALVIPELDIPVRIPLTRDPPSGVSP